MDSAANSLLALGLRCSASLADLLGNHFYEFHSFEGAGRAFMSRQPAAGSPNHTAAQASWPLAVAFLRRHVE